MDPEQQLVDHSANFEASAAAGASFGVNLAAVNSDGSWELPIPATFVIGRDGCVKRSHAETDYRKRLSPKAIVDALRPAMA